MEITTARESSIRWWNLLTNTGKRMFMKGDLFLRDEGTLNESEIERIWIERQQPSLSNSMRHLTGPELIGRAVEITSSLGYNSYSTIVSCSKTCFKIDGRDGSFQIGSGRRRGDAESWNPVYARVVSPNFANMELARRKAEIYLKKTKEAIIHEINSGRPTLKQLEAACTALGLS